MIKTIPKGNVINTYDQDEEILDQAIETNQQSSQKLQVNKPAIDIIEIELKDLYKQVVVDGIMMDKDQTSKFEKLVKCLVALQGGEVKDEKKKKKTEDVNTLLKRVMSA